MRILHVVASAEIGGAERHVLDLVAMQRARGNVAMVACPGGGSLAAALQREGVEVFPWHAGGRIFPWTRWSLAAAIRRARADVLHAHMAKSAWLVHRVAPQAAAVATAHTIVRSDAFADYTQVICVSQAVRDSLLATGFPEARAFQVHNAIDLERFRVAENREALRLSLGLQPGDCVLVQVGRLEPVKGHLYALQAIERLLASGCPVRLLIVGEGSLRPNLEKYVRKHGLETGVTFLGFREDVHAVLQMSDVCLMPSLKEGFGLAMVEAMACGVVPVAFSVGGIPESVTHGIDGFLVEKDDISGLVEAVRSLCKDASLRQRMATAAHDSVLSRSSREQWVEKVLGIYRRALNNSTSSVGT